MCIHFVSQYQQCSDTVLVCDIMSICATYVQQCGKCTLNMYNAERKGGMYWDVQGVFLHWGIYVDIDRPIYT